MSVRNKWSVLSALVILTLLTVACAQVPFLATPGQQTEAVVETPTAVVEVITDAEEDTLSDLYQQVVPGVVSVQVMRLGPDNELGGGAGSGFVLDKQGHIVTNAHVVRDAELVDVVLYDDTTVPAEIIGLDDDSDLAVIKIDVPADQLTPLPLGDSDAVIPGHEVIAIGNPFGRQSSMTYGIVSAVGRTIPSLTPFSIPQAIQTDAAINPGNSGGPLLNLDGDVIGVNAQIDSAVRANAGVGFAIPSNIVARVAPVLIAEGDFAWPWLGVQGTDLTVRIAKANELNVTRGAYLTRIVPDSPAAEAGLQGLSGETVVDNLPIPTGGDVVLEVAGQEVRSMDDLILLISQQDIGDRVTLTVLRSGEEIEVPVALAARPEGPEQS